MRPVSWVEAQNLVLSSAFHNGPEVWDMVDPADMGDMYRDVAAALKAIGTRGRKVTVETLTAECARRGIAANVTRWMMYPIPAEQAAAAFHDAHTRLRIEQAFARASQQIAEGADHWDMVDDVIGLLDTLARPAPLGAKYGKDWGEVLALQEEAPEWVLPGLLARNDRLVITGGEGQGKSLLVYQLVLGAAFGVSPLDGEERFDRKRVLLLDVENSEHQIAGHYRMLSAAYKARAAEPMREPEVRLMVNRFIDLTRPADRRMLVDAANDYQPDLLFMGSGYRLADGTQDHRMVAMSIQQTVDQIRANTGCAALIETHAGHGFQNDRNGWRPEGSSYWLRWPEFGFGLAPVSVRSGRVVRRMPWRGDRIVGREWPDGWRGGGSLPWLPVDEAQIELVEVAS
jgi:replicative DNA helicase